MGQPQLDRDRHAAAEHIAETVRRYHYRSTPLTAVLTAALKRRKVSDPRLTPTFVEAAMRRAYPGNLLSELYRVQFEEAIDEAMATLRSLTLDECNALAIAEDVAYEYGVPMCEPEPVAPAPAPRLDFRTAQRRLREVLPESRPATPAEQRAVRSASTRAARGPRERVRVTVIEDAPPPSAPTPPDLDMPFMSKAAGDFLNKSIAGHKFSGRLHLLTYISYIWPAAHGGRADDDATRIQAYVAAIWPTYAAAYGLPADG